MRNPTFFGAIDSDIATASNYIVDELMLTETVPENMVKNMKLRWFFNVIAYEIFNDEDFVNKPCGKFPKLARLLQEKGTLPQREP